MKMYIANAMSLSMLQPQHQSDYPNTSSRQVIPRPVENPKEFLKEWENIPETEIISILGHAATQGLFEKALDREVPVNRINFKFSRIGEYAIREELVLVGQYDGPRLPEGATELPEGATLEWWVL